MLNLYKLTQKVNNSWDTFDSIIVAAESKEEAQGITPNQGYELDDYEILSVWCAKEDVKVEYVGTAATGIKKGVILNSFNAG